MRLVSPCGIAGGASYIPFVGALGYSSTNVPPYQELQYITYDNFNGVRYSRQISNIGQKLDSLWDLGTTNKAFLDQAHITCGDLIPIVPGIYWDALDTYYASFVARASGDEVHARDSTDKAGETSGVDGDVGAKE